MTSPVILPIHAGQAEATADLVSVLAVGPWHENEFTAARAGVDEAEGWPTVENLDVAIDRLSTSSTPPELVLLAQSLPGYYRQHDLDRLQRAVPLSRIVVVAGTWCEGELRTGTRLAGVLRLYWYEFAPWWQTARKRLTAGLCPPWSVPLDTPLAGRYLDEPNAARPTNGEFVAIDTLDFSMFGAISEALVGYGFQSVWQPHGRDRSARKDAVAGIWDGGQLGPQEMEQLAEFCRPLADRDAPVIALLDFPRLEHRGQARAAGAAAVFGKPFVVEELVGALL